MILLAVAVLTGAAGGYFYFQKESEQSKKAKLEQLERARVEQERLAAGKVEARRVLEVEAGVFEVKQGLADSLVRSERATLELALAEGSLLKSRNLEFTPTELRDQTLLLLGDRKKPAKGQPVAAGKQAPPAEPKMRFTASKLTLRDSAP